MNAYSFLKAAVFRFLHQQFKNKTPERAYIAEYIKSVTTGTEGSFVHLVETICQQFPETGPAAYQQVQKFNPQVVLNMGESAQDLEMGRRLRSLVTSKLGIRIDFIGFIPKDRIVPLAVAKRTPVCILEPNSNFAKALDKVGDRVLAYEYGFNDSFIENSDLDLLRSEYPTESNIG